MLLAQTLRVRALTVVTASTAFLFGGYAEAAAPTAPSVAEPDAPSPPVEPSPPADANRDAQLRALEQRVDALQREVDALRDTETETGTEPEPPPATTPPPKAPATAPPVPAKKATRKSADSDADPDQPPDFADGFHFGSYGRVVIGGDHRGRKGRDADIVARGSRLDESTYTELELRREDYWEKTGSYTRIVATVALAPPLFHESGQFDATFGVRNLYIEEAGLGLPKLRIWAGSRMYRGDDIYLLDFWPLDNLNTVGGGLAYTFLENLTVKLHAGVNQPNSPFFLQQTQRPLPHNQLGEAAVNILDRQRLISSGKISNIFKLGATGGIKPVLYGEFHYVPSGQQEIDTRVFQDVPADFGWLLGTQIGLFTGKDSTHLNLIFRYAAGLAAYGEFNAPTQLDDDRRTRGAREILAAVSGNYEYKWLGLLLGGYFRSFRNASSDLDFDDLNEGILIARPTAWFGKFAGLSVEGSWQAQRRGILVPGAGGTSERLFAQLGRVGVVPFVSPGGRGNFTRPHIRLIYLLTMRSDDARSLYPRDDVFSIRSVDHYIGLGAEWWFGSTSYFRD